jgi:molybdenum cofactor biosynthesis protein B
MSGDIPSGARALVLTVSDGVAVGTRQDESGIALGDRLAILGFRVDRRTVSDERSEIEAALREAAQDHTFVISTGGTGLTPRDVTPQATLAVVDYEVPGLAEAMRAAGRATTPMADLARGRRCHRTEPRGQRSGQPEGSHGVAGRARAHDRARARDARRAV